MENLSNAFPNKAERNDFFIALAVILFFIIGNSLFLFQNNESSSTPLFAETEDKQEIVLSPVPIDQQTETSKSLAIENEVIEEDMSGQLEDNPQLTRWIDSLESQKISNTIVIPEEYTSEQSLPEKTTDAAVELEDEESTTSNNEVVDTINSIADKDIDTVAQNNTVAVNKIIPDKNLLVDTLTKIESDTEEVDTQSDKNSSPTPQSEAVNNNTSTDDQYGCIIVLGSFENKENAIDFGQRLKKDGYPLYLGANRGYHVVGVNTPCETSKWKDLMQTLRKKYYKDAWLLRR